MKRLILTFCALFLIFTAQVMAQAPIKVMILDGETNPYHRWDLGTPILKMLLEETKKFDVTVISAPAKDGDFSTFMPKFSDYKAIVLNYDVPDDRWPDALKKSFEQYMANGGGLVVIHAANNSFRNG